MVVLTATTIGTTSRLHKIKAIPSTQRSKKSFIARWVVELASSSIVTLSCRRYVSLFDSHKVVTMTYQSSDNTSMAPLRGDEDTSLEDVRFMLHGFLYKLVHVTTLHIPSTHVCI